MRNKFEFQEVSRGAHFSQLQLDRAEFRYCETKTRLPERPSAYFEHIRVGSLKARRSKIRYSTLNDVRIGNLDLDTDSSFLVGNTYFGVVFEGTVKSGLIFLAVSPLSDDASGQWEVIRSAEADPAWSIDISRMSGHVSVRGYSADGFIINREFQCIVRNDPTSFKGWRAFDFGDSLFPYSLDLMERMGWRDTVLSADATSPDFSSQVELIHKLRAIGISE